MREAEIDATALLPGSADDDKTLTMRQYKAYGMRFESELPLSELLIADDPKPRQTDVNISERHVDMAKPADARGGPTAWATRDQVYMEFEDAGAYLIRGGSAIFIRRKPGVADSVVRLYLLGPVLGILLHQRGFLVLHASSVRINGVAAAFLAEKGTGKSTLAAAFHARGHLLVADDLVPVDLDAPEGPIAYPGFPQLKLFPEAAMQLRERPDELPRLLPDMEKRACRIEEPFSEQPLALRGVYVLSDGDSERIDDLGGQQAFMSLVRHSFVLGLLKATSTDIAHFRQAVKLSQVLPIRSLQRRRILSVLPDVVKLVEVDLARG